MSYKGDMQKIRTRLHRLGWRLEPSSRQHEKWWPADKALGPVIVASTQCGGRAWQNMIGDLRRRGVEI